MPVRAIALSLLLTFPMIATATTLNFDEIAPGTKIGKMYEANGFVLFGTAWDSSSQFAVPTQQDARWTGSSGFVFNSVGATIKLQSSEGNFFDAISIDLSRGDSNGGLVPVGFLGIKDNDERVVSTYWFTDRVMGRNQTFVLGDGFQNLKSLTWSQGAEWHQFDNIVLSASTTIPEPSTLWLLAPVLVGLFSSSRKFVC